MQRVGRSEAILAAFRGTLCNILQRNFGEFTFRNCLENQDGSRIRGYESLREGSKGLRTAASCRRSGTSEGPSAIVQTVSRRTRVNKNSPRTEQEGEGNLQE